MSDGILDLDFNTLVDNSLVSAIAVFRQVAPSPVFAVGDTATT